jgi:hypothetical protein
MYEGLLSTLYDPKQSHMRSLKKIGRGIGFDIALRTLSRHDMLANSADSRAKRSTNQPDNTYLLIPSYNCFQN